MADDARSADRIPDDDVQHLDPSYNSDGDAAAPVWERSHALRKLVENPKTDSTSRATLEEAAVKQVRTALLYEQVTGTYQRVKANDEAMVLMLYVIVFPGEARDNTGMNDLNDNVLGYSLHTEYIRARQQQIRDIYNAPFTVVGQDYKTALVLAQERERKGAANDNRKIFDERLRKLDAALRDELIAVLKEAEKNPQHRKEARKLRRTLEKNSDYRFDIYYGLTAVTLAVVDAA